MPRDGSGVYSPPPGTGGSPNTTILSNMFNAYVADVAATLNGAWPVPLGGTGLSSLEGAVVGSIVGTYVANGDITAAIPFDDTLPQSSEGAQIISVSYTPKSASNKLRLRFNAQASAAAVTNVAAAVFHGGSANAIGASYTTVPASAYGQAITLVAEYTPGAITAQTITVRVGVASGTARLNGSGTGRLFGGASAATLVVEEIQT